MRASTPLAPRLRQGVICRDIRLRQGVICRDIRLRQGVICGGC